MASLYLQVPGSYTGLRVGMASAKGLSFALNKPLLTIGTLEILAYATILSRCLPAGGFVILFVPWIDARRMEVFTALYDKDMNVVMEPCVHDSEPTTHLLIGC